MIAVPNDMDRFEFACLSALRAKQLIGGCDPRIPPSLKHTTTAQREVSLGEVRNVSHQDAAEAGAERT